ncbi:hypothetical protein SAMN05421766_10833 [Zobellia uliginosa]|uniref:Uncharacterized protein n=1 Tax=Zobellia uliginosa TaxID=143224 RepID=A0ABY1L5A3_9FLAO|nr:hypothetical protein [Zobellia uliginosa]SIT05445.1 hypothetical protein SAMN05421766_10833 [Zobellia uliginosa]
MGWDISYHPISEKQINKWYFDVLDNQSLIEKLSTENNIEDFYKEKYENTIKVALETKQNDIFDKSHGYYVAVVQGFFEKFFYTRGAALSFSEKPFLQAYYKKWNEIVPNERLTEQVHNAIIENYCSGVYIPADKVAELLEDYENNPEIKSELDNLFSYDRIKVFLKALNYAKDHDLGLLEATEVVEPNPLDLNQSSCYSNLLNCDPEGAILYRQAAMEQIAEIEKQEKLKEGEIAANAEYKVRNIAPEKKEAKKGFWKKLFGK